MAESAPKKQTGGIWSRITPDQFVAAVASLGNRVKSLAKQTWRVKDDTREETSVWREVINRLNIADTEETRHSLYNIWYKRRENVRQRVIQELKKRGVSTDGIDSSDTEQLDGTSNEDNNSNLHPNPSLPLPERPKTRANKKNGINNDDQSSRTNDLSFILSLSDWKAAFSSTNETLRDEWTNIFYNKLKDKDCGITCALRFGNRHIKLGHRKQSRSYFWFDTVCTNSSCSRRYRVVLQNKVSMNTSPMFRVEIYGKLNHDRTVETMSRQLTGEERRRVGKRAQEIGPSAVFRERLEAADEACLEEGNFSAVNSIEVNKKAAADYRKLYRIDEDIFFECRVAASIFRTTDTDSTDIKGYIQVVGEMPFRLHLFSEKQIEQYVNHCKKEKYSFVHLDATSGVIKKIKNQGAPLLYTMLIKTGNDPINNIPIAHSVLTDNTVPSISYFLGNVAHSITNYKRKLVLPSFFVTDFSAALMNSILQSFNGENINTHLSRCWNVLSRKYNKVQLRSLSFIHLCCCHVIHAIARSFTGANVDKKIRRNLLYIFSLILCGDDLEQLYDLLGSLIDIFGNPSEQNATDKFERLLDRELNVDEESEKLLKDGESILIGAEKDDELELVDEYLRSNTPIIHQSPFNIEAIRRYPLLKDLLNNKSKIRNNGNPLFSRSIVRIIYRWWAYLPLWTGLLWNFERKYSNDVAQNITLSYFPYRYSNAVIESYFRTLKTSILQKQIKNTPRELIEAIYESIKVQLKGVKYGVAQSSKGRKRKKQDITPVEKHKKGTGKIHRAIYVGVVDKVARMKRQKQQTNVETISESESACDNMSIASSSQSSIDFNNVDVNMQPIDLCEAIYDNSISPSSTASSIESREYSINIPVNLDQPITTDQLIDDDEQSNASTEFEYDENRNLSSVIETIYPTHKKPGAKTNQSLYRSEIVIDGQTFAWPRFEVKNAVYNGKSYNLFSTCPVDSVLFSLYFINHTDLNIAQEFREAPSTSVYSTLAEIFRIVESDGWDKARLYWLLHFRILDPTKSQSISLFDQLDRSAVGFLEEEQRYHSTVICSREDCPNKQQTFTCTKIDLFASDTEFSKLKDEYYTNCITTIKNLNEITETEAAEQKYKKAKINVYNQRTYKTEAIDVWQCNGFRCTSVATFSNDYPPIIIAEIKPPLSKRGDEGYAESYARLRDMKTIVTIGDNQYRLRAVIHHKDRHFAATCIGVDNEFYHFDDQVGIRQGRPSTDLVEYGIYTRIFTF